MKVFKYELNPETTLELPIGAKVLSCGVQNEKIFIWVLLDCQNKKENRFFFVYGTGHEIGDKVKLHFIDTVHMHSLGLVLHVFEELK